MMPQIQWREPLWLLLTIIPWLQLGIMWLRHRKNVSQRQIRLTAFADPHLWQHLISGDIKSLPNKNMLIWIAAWTFAALAASGPYIQKQIPDTTVQANGIDIAVIMDISPSMSVQDIAPNRLERAKLELRDFVSRLHGDRVALLAFSANAYVTLPLTPDKEAFLHFADLLDPGLVIKHGSNLARALLMARRTLEGAEQQSHAIILITDGETHNNTAALAEADILRTSGIPLFIVGVGTEAGGPVPDGKGYFMKINNELVVSQLARATLTALANRAGGLYVDLRGDDREWQQLFTQLRTLKPARYNQDIPAQRYQLFPWLLVMSLSLFIWMFLWQNIQQGRMMFLAMAICLPLLVSPQQAKATPWEEQRALEALKKNDHAQATVLYRGIKSFNGFMGLGASAYRQRQWETALNTFRIALRSASNDVERAQASYNIGNTLAQLNRLDEAARSYETALAWQKNYPRAALNLTLINKEINKEKERRARIGDEAISNSKKIPIPNQSTQVDKNDHGFDSNKTITGNISPAQTQKDQAAQVRQQMQALHENAQELLRNRFSAADKFSGVLVVEDEKPW